MSFQGKPLILAIYFFSAVKRRILPSTRVGNVTREEMFSTFRLEPRTKSRHVLPEVLPSTVKIVAFFGKFSLATKCFTIYKPNLYVYRSQMPSEMV